MPSKATIQKISSLAHKKYRDKWGLFIAEGDKLVSDLLSSQLAIEDLYITEESRLTRSKFLKKEVVSREDMKKLSLLKTPSTSLATVRIPATELKLDQLNNKLTLVLDGIQDPGNLGTIIRLADWFGIGQIACSTDSADCYNPKVVQATMGAIARVEVSYTNLNELLDKIDPQLPVYGTFLNGDTIYNLELSPNGLIVMGNEGKGISPAVEQKVKQRLYIPSFTESSDKSESLNVAVATAIICSEFKRRSC